MKIVAISDTHNRHNKLIVPDGDILIHAGDVTSQGKQSQVEDFLKWFSKHPHPHKIFIAGNHDFFFERMPDTYIQSLIPENVTYLNDSGITIEGIKIWGSPVQPWFYDWAFNRQRGADIQKHWDLIPNDTDILITHGPVQGILDKTIDGTHVGCVDLMNTVRRIRPKYFICGHIHEAYGRAETIGTTYINASVLDVRYQLVNQPIVFEY
jgi:Icc-related predicted phosphoesterase